MSRDQPAHTDACKRKSIGERHAPDPFVISGSPRHARPALTICSAKPVGFFVDDTSPRRIWPARIIACAVARVGCCSDGIVGGFGEVGFSFSARRSYYQQADLHHYVGDAIYPAFETQVIDTSEELTELLEDRLIVSNSLPIWLSLPPPGVPIYPEISNQIQVMMGDVLAGTKTPEAALDAANAAVQAAYSRL